MYVKIPPNLGDQNINLTMEYLQEEEDPTLDKVEEEEGNSSFTSFRFILIITPNHNIGSLILHELAFSTSFLEYLYVFLSCSQFPRESGFIFLKFHPN